MIQVQVEDLACNRFHKYRILYLEVLQCHCHRIPVKRADRRIVGEVIHYSDHLVSILKTCYLHLAGCVGSILHLKRLNIVRQQVHKISHGIKRWFLVLHLEIKSGAQKAERLLHIGIYKVGKSEDRAGLADSEIAAHAAQDCLCLYVFIKLDMLEGMCPFKFGRASAFSLKNNDFRVEIMDDLAKSHEIVVAVVRILIIFMKADMGEKICLTHFFQIIQDMTQV